MPELPEAERARQQIERALGREIVAVDDRDTYVCRPHAPGEIAAALVGRRLTRRTGAASSCGPRPTAGPTSACTSGWRAGSCSTRSRSRWDRFVLEFADGGRLALRDRRRLGRAVIEPDFDHVGPDAAEVSRDAVPLARRPRDDARSRRGCSTSARSRASATCSRTRRCGGRGSRRGRPAGELTDEELDHLRRVLRAATRDAIRKGGVHTGTFIPYRKPRRALPALRDHGRAGHDRRPHDVLVPRLSASLTRG